MHWADGLFWHVVLDYMCSGEKVLTSSLLSLGTRPCFGPLRNAAKWTSSIAAQIERGQVAISSGESVVLLFFTLEQRAWNGRPRRSCQNATPTQCRIGLDQ